jgi:monoamine oxidase
MKFYLDELELAFPGAIEHYSSRWQTALWTKHPRQQGSYACYKPGQISRYRNVLAKPAGQIYFAGEYASEEYQGYMNGAVDSGQNAARQLLQRLKTRRTPSAKPVGKR